MNYDLLIKLVRLATNNPNDNEANLAARKACQLIADANFNFPAHNGGHTPRASRPQPQGNPSPPPKPPPRSNPFTEGAWDHQRAYDRQQEDVRNAENERQRQYWYRRHPEDNPFDFASIFEELNRQQEKERQRRGYKPYDPEREQERERKRRQREADEWERIKRDEAIKAKLEKEERDRQRGYDFNNPKRPMMCNKCKQMKASSFIGPPELFICNSCMWDVAEEKIKEEHQK